MIKANYNKYILNQMENIMQTVADNSNKKNRKVTNEVFLAFAQHWLQDSLLVGTNSAQNMRVTLGNSSVGPLIKVGSGKWLKEMLQNSSKFQKILTILMPSCPDIKEIPENHFVFNPLLIAFLNEHIKEGLVEGVSPNLALSKIEICEILSDLNNYLVVDSISGKKSIAEFATYNVEFLASCIQVSTPFGRIHNILRTCHVNNLEQWLMDNLYFFSGVIIAYMSNVNTVDYTKANCRTFDFENH